MRARPALLLQGAGKGRTGYPRDNEWWGRLSTVPRVQHNRLPMTHCGNTGQGYQQTPQLQQEHGPRHARRSTWPQGIAQATHVSVSLATA